MCYFIEIFVLPQTQPSFLEMGRALVSPHFRQAGMVYVAIGIIGATVMPHNLYLHSALVQSRKLQKDEPSVRSAIRFNTIDSMVALTHRLLRQCGDSGAGGNGVLRQGKRDRSRRAGGPRSAPTAIGFASPT